MGLNEDLLARIAELTNVVKENGGLNGLRREDLVTDLKSVIEEQTKNLLEQMPVRRGEETNIPAGAEHQVKGRYARLVKEIASHGEARVNGTPVKAVDFLMAKILLDKAQQMKAQNISFEKMETLRPASDDLNEVVKIMTSTVLGSGGELVPENLAGEIWEDMYLASRVFADLPEQPMTSDPMDISLLGGMTFKKGTQGTASTTQNVATSGMQLKTTELLADVEWSYNLDEDSIIAMMPVLRQVAARDGAAAMDAFALNADATNAAVGNINLDDADPADDTYYLTEGQDGIRHAYLIDNTAMGVAVAAALDDAKMASILAKLGKYGLDLENCRIVPDVQTYLSMLSLASVKTVDVYGAQATIVRGELAKYRGIPVMPSAAMPLTEADGKVSTVGANNTKGQLAAYNRLQWRRGQRRGLTIEVDRDIRSRKLILVVSFRIATGCRGARATQPHTAGGYNITV